jgi:hypothetical protein
VAQFLRERCASVFGAGAMDVFLRTPDAMGGNQGISLWLYRVTRDESLTNVAPARLGPRTLRRTPLPLRLHYLVTPVASSDDGGPEMEQTILGRVLQSFYDTSLLRGALLRDDFQNTDIELNVRLETLSVDELSRIWQALTAPMRLSASYEVSVVSIASELPDETITPVLVAVPDYGTIVDAEPVTP